MSYSFTRTREGTFDKKLGEILCNYFQMKERALIAQYVDITLVDEENSVVIYKQLQDIQFYIQMEQEKVRIIGMKVGNIRITYEIEDREQHVYCRVETEKNGMKIVFYPTLITVFN